MVYMLMDRLGIEYVSYDVTLPENEPYFDKIVSMGYAAVPVVLDTDTGEHFAGFQPDKIKALTT